MIANELANPAGAMNCQMGIALSLPTSDIRIGTIIEAVAVLLEKNIFSTHTIAVVKKALGNADILRMPENNTLANQIPALDSCIADPKDRPAVTVTKMLRSTDFSTFAHSISSDPVRI